MSDARHFVIVGAGQAGRWLALTLRDSGFTGRLSWFGAERHAPYDRPPLSKAVLKGEASGIASVQLLDDERFAALACAWHPDTTVTAIDRGASTITTARGDRVSYDLLFLAQGGRARRLPGLALHPRVLTLRTWDDAQALKQQLAQARTLLVLGGGWIGLEVAASARQLGLDVAVLEAAPRLCMRSVPPVVSEHLQGLHERHGVRVHLGSPVARVAPDDEGVSVTLGDGRTLRADLLLVGIGLVPHDELAAAAGLPCDNGVLTDAQGRTADPAIFAVGDMAQALRVDGRRQRLESWENAQRQAQAAAKAALGLAHDAQADGPPWFWSDQYEDNLQVLGEPDGAQHLIERSDPARRQRLLFFCEGSAIRALVAVNGGRELKLVRKWIRERRFPPLDRLGDTTIELNKLPLQAAEATTTP